MAEGGVMRHEGTLRVALAFAALLGSLSMVVWRQSRALSMLRELDTLRSERAMMESERSRLSERIQHLESRTRVLEVAAERWGMRVPEAGEVWILRLHPDTTVVRPTAPLRVATVGVATEVRD
jgi:cell division protein FtsL